MSTEDKREADPSHPGPVDNSSILDKENPFLKDPNVNFNHFNQQLRLGLKEQEDYLVLKPELWNFLTELYKFKTTQKEEEVQRFAIPVNEQTCIVEVYP